MLISITDDFSLSKIADSGQCFRVKKFPAGMFRFVFRDQVLYISEVSPSVYEVSCSVGEWKEIWHRYFDLDTNYADIRAGISRKDDYLLSAAAAAKGIRILRQDPLEMVITFIISQRKSIPAIKGAVERLCASCGRLIHTEYEDIYLFPDVTQMKMLGTDDLTACSLGYRVPYVEDALEKIRSGAIDLTGLSSLSDADLTDSLKSIKGVGDKVANCISLFAYHRTSCAPVDVWIGRVIDRHYGGRNPFPDYGDLAGIMQQFIFYYAQSLKNGR